MCVYYAVMCIHWSGAGLRGKRKNVQKGDKPFYSPTSTQVKHHFSPNSMNSLKLHHMRTEFEVIWLQEWRRTCFASLFRSLFTIETTEKKQMTNLCQDAFASTRAHPRGMWSVRDGSQGIYCPTAAEEAKDVSGTAWVIGARNLSSSKLQTKKKQRVLFRV